MYTFLVDNLDKFKPYRKHTTTDGYTLVVFYLKTSKDTIYMLRTVGKDTICATNIFFFIKNNDIYFVLEKDKKFIDDIKLVWYAGIDVYRGTQIYKVKNMDSDMGTNIVFNLKERVYFIVNNNIPLCIKDMCLYKLIFKG